MTRYLLDPFRDAVKSCRAECLAPDRWECDHRTMSSLLAHLEMDHGKYDYPPTPDFKVIGIPVEVNREVANNRVVLVAGGKIFTIINIQERE